MKKYNVITPLESEKKKEKRFLAMLSCMGIRNLHMWFNSDKPGDDIIDLKYIL